MTRRLRDVRAELYAVPLDRFAAARAALVQKRREEGDQAGARAAAGVRRPTRALWAVNQLSRTNPRLLKAFLEDASGVESGLRAVLGGGDVETYKRASRRESDELTRLSAAAGRLVTRPGARPSARLERELMQLLTSAARTPETRAALGNGAFSGAAPTALEVLARLPMPSRRPAQSARAHERAVRAESEAVRQRAAAERATQRAKDAARRAVRAEEQLLAFSRSE